MLLHKEEVQWRQAEKENSIQSGQQFLPYNRGGERWGDGGRYSGLSRSGKQLEEGGESAI
jgi:hypothetical protein